MALEDHDIDRLKEIFVTRHECQEQKDTFESKMTKELVRLAVIEADVKQQKWLTAAVVGGVITMLIKMFFGG
jgi:hypothetical protein